MPSQQSWWRRWLKLMCPSRSRKDPEMDLNADAEALDRVAQVTEYLAGLADGDGESEKATSMRADAATMRRYAEMWRNVASQQG